LRLPRRDRPVLSGYILFAVQSFEIVTVAAIYVAIYVIGMAACWRYLAARSKDQGARRSF